MNDDVIAPKMLIVLEFLPACGMSFYKAGLRAGYSDSYGRKLSSKFASDERLQQALRDRVKRLLAEADESDRVVLERLLQRQLGRSQPSQTQGDNRIALYGITRVRGNQHQRESSSATVRIHRTAFP